jgi:hypothetical protein
VYEYLPRIGIVGIRPPEESRRPLAEVRRREWEVQNIADVLVDPEGALERRNR